MVTQSLVGAFVERPLTWRKGPELGRATEGTFSKQSVLRREKAQVSLATFLRFLDGPSDLAAGLVGGLHP